MHCVCLMVQVTLLLIGSLSLTWCSSKVERLTQLRSLLNLCTTSKQLLIPSLRLLLPLFFFLCFSSLLTFCLLHFLWLFPKVTYSSRFQDGLDFTRWGDRHFLSHLEISVPLVLIERVASGLKTLSQVTRSEESPRSRSLCTSGS